MSFGMQHSTVPRVVALQLMRAAQQLVCQLYRCPGRLLPRVSLLCASSFFCCTVPPPPSPLTPFTVPYCSEVVPLLQGCGAAAVRAASGSGVSSSSSLVGHVDAMLMDLGVSSMQVGRCLGVGV